METKSEQLVHECRRQAEGCLYTSTSLFIWLRVLRFLKVIFIVAPLVLGSLASGKLLLTVNVENAKAFSAVCAFIAGLLPSIYAALKFDDRLKECAVLAAEFKNLQDRFRQATFVVAKRTFPEFETHFNELMSRLEVARKPSFTAPEWCFRRAQKKIKEGHYDFDVDISKSAVAKTGVEEKGPHVR